jgi:hypothetical protein
MLMSSSKLTVVSAVYSALIVGACGSRPEPAPAPAPEPAKQTLTKPAPLQPPKVEFVAPTTWTPRFGKAAPVEPPDLDKETWRVLVTQTDPLQRKTPLWQSIPARETVEIEMQPDSTYRCVVQPLVVKPKPDEMQTKLEAWELLRTFLCSPDGWHSWTEHTHRDLVAPDGDARDRGEPTGVLLRERGGEQIRYSFVMMRTDKEIREAAKGPPRIVVPEKKLKLAD